MDNTIRLLARTELILERTMEDLSTLCRAQGFDLIDHSKWSGLRLGSMTAIYRDLAQLQNEIRKELLSTPQYS